jgi:LysM repeat protein
VLAALLAVLVGTVVRAQTSNLLQNPGFDGPYRSVSKVGGVASGWTAWAIPRKASDPSYVLTPQFRQAQNVGRARSNSTAQEFYEVYAVYDAGVYQQVTVPTQASVQFSAYINVWSSALDDANKSEQPSPVLMRVGIDPTGGIDPTASTIVWSSDKTFQTDPSVYDQFTQYSVSAIATDTKVTVFIEGGLQAPIAHGDFYIDDAALTATGGGAATSTATTAATTAVPTTAVATTAAPQPSLTVSATDTKVAGTPSDTPNFTVPTREGTIIATDTPIGGIFITVTPMAFATFTTTPISTGTNATLTGKITYVVQAGDTLSDLAVRFDSDVDAIIQANGLDASGLIFVGQTLIIPVAATTPTVTPSPQIIYVTATPVVPQSPTAPVDAAALTGPTVNGIGTYIVQPGDTFAAIARRYNISVDALAALNGIVNPGQVAIGTVLVVPGPGNNYPGGTIAPTAMPTNPVPAKPNSYVVKPGDNLYRISIKFNVTLDALMRANNLASPNLIYVGQTLIIP